jgi:hypothetical protein
LVPDLRFQDESGARERERERKRQSYGELHSIAENNVFLAVYW